MASRLRSVALGVLFIAGAMLTAAGSTWGQPAALTPTPTPIPTEQPSPTATAAVHPTR